MHFFKVRGGVGTIMFAFQMLGKNNEHYRPGERMPDALFYSDCKSRIAWVSNYLLSRSDGRFVL
jgi:hypothetical protein